LSITQSLGEKIVLQMAQKTVTASLETGMTIPRFSLWSGKKWFVNSIGLAGD
jgi:hypothetical protein